VVELPVVELPVVELPVVELLPVLEPPVPPVPLVPLVLLVTLPLLDPTSDAPLLPTQPARRGAMHSTNPILDSCMEGPSSQPHSPHRNLT
jgi:hypothetical protein